MVMTKLKLNNRIKAIHERLDAKFGRINGRLDSLSADIKSVNSTLSADIKSVNDSLSILSGKFELFVRELRSDLQKDISERESRYQIRLIYIVSGLHIYYIMPSK
jgi:predicted helicase